MRDILRSIPLFSGLNDEEMELVATLVSVREMLKDSVVVQAGEIGEHMFIILEGAVKISCYTADGREIILSLLESGTFFGEMAILDEAPRSATVVTMENSKFGQIKRADFQRVMGECPQLMRKMLTEVIARLRRTSLMLERVSTMDVPNRLYAYISDYCHRFGEVENHCCMVKLPTHQLIADQLSTSRETISRAISVLQKEGIITSLKGRGQMRIDISALNTLLQVTQ